jgi:hypothetical protein|tara:strand:+ start:1390 stop:1560 length:171 start_codon:yes stop_codon:yes gene_type:complete
MIKYRLVSKQILEENLSYDDAIIAMQILKDQGIDVEMEKYIFRSDASRLGRDPDLH